MLGRKSHDCVPHKPPPAILLPEAHKVEFLDNCALPPIDQSTPIVIETKTTTMSKHNPFQNPLNPSEQRHFDTSGLISGDVAPWIAAAKVAEELRAIPETALSQPFCRVHNVHMPDFLVDFTMVKCARCGREARAMLLQSQSKAFYETPGDMLERAQYFLPPDYSQFIDLAVRWGISLKWQPSRIHVSGYLMNCCSNCSELISGFRARAASEPLEFVVDRRRLYWCSACAEYSWSGQLDDIAERLKARLASETL
jgi:hypothetical protein